MEQYNKKGTYRIRKKSTGEVVAQERVQPQALRTLHELKRYYSDDLEMVKVK